jgi:signal transduction histidine kinase
MVRSRAEHFKERLWTMEGESAWQPLDVSTAHGGMRVLGRYLEEILNEIRNTFPEVTAAYAGIAGIEAGVFKPIVATGRGLQGIVPSRSSEANTLVSQVLLHTADDVVIIENPAKRPLYRGSSDIAAKAVIKLRGYGELFGFISLDTHVQQGFAPSFLDEMRYIQPALSRVLAESVFSMRLWEATFSLGNPGANQTIDDIYKSIAERTLVAFAASGAVVRVFDPNAGRLPAKEFAGPHRSKRDDEVMEFLLDPVSIGEQVAHKVFDDPQFHWTIGMLEDNRDPFFSGTAISAEDESKLREGGIHAYGVFRLESEFSSLSQTHKRIGTLSFFHRHPRRYSWRDVALAKALSQRAADLIALHRQTTRLAKTSDELLKKNKELQVAYDNIELESRVLTRVEVVSLLAHDLGHRAIAVVAAVERFIREVIKALRENKQFGSISSDAEKLREAANAVKLGLYSVNQLFSQRSNSPVEEEFHLREVVEEVFRTLEEPLERNDIVKSVTIPETIKLRGNKSILLQVLFNLVINSIDAQKMRRHPRRNTIYLDATIDSSDVILKFWDEGPGINRAVFPDPNEIFDLGATSKPEGTGRGLPISRNLLNVYYGADMSLVDPRTAHFRIRIPTGRRS